jgi:hypothetical protein
MDAQKNVELADRLATIPRIRQRSVEWVAARPSQVLHLGLAAVWLGFLFTIGLFSAPTADPASTAPLGFVDFFAMAMFLVTLGGIFAVIGLALRNNRATAAVSAAAGLAIIVVGATCGFAGHPVSAWGPDAVLAAGIVAASVAIMARRQPASEG